ncbi:MAG TPA: glycoside hydrolase family 2 TIM barrel-domain containing protein [Mobilitalea sp.]|nr:glycoside hydrolase family 2 TIM barrel-domain containing protein [Mobilitalea sp.]
MAKKILFNDGWLFTKKEVGTLPQSLKNHDIPWSEVDIPHDWLIYNSKDLYETSEGWYKKSFTIDDISDRVISICFEGVYMNSTVYVNDAVAGEWKYGYSSFEFDITGFLRTGRNEIMVRVVYQSPNSRWYSGAGIYRNVWLKTSSPSHLVTDGTYLATRKVDFGWHVELGTEAISNAPVDGMVKHIITDMQGNEIAVSKNAICIGYSIAYDKQDIFVQNPDVWSIETPSLYQLITQLVIHGEVVDEEVQKFGFRTTRFDTQEGFFLNDKQVKLHGANMHHDLGALGSAVNKAALRRQLMMLKEMGVNAIRTSHNMPAVELMELADELGILIDSEAFDMWELKKTDYDYARFFKEWCAKDVASWIRRDRNHPSIILWSIGNEIYDTHASERGLEITKLLKDLT